MSLDPVCTSTMREPNPRWALDDADDCDVAACGTFLDRLDTMTCTDWLDLTRRARVAPVETLVALDAVIAARRLGVTAWLVRDAIETSACLACEGASPDDVIAARRVCEHAALALLVGPWLDRATYRALLGPFVPLALG